MARKKKTSMAKQVEKTEKGEQGVLIDVEPENAKEIMAILQVYKAHQTDRLKALAKEVEQKEKLLDLVKKAVEPDRDGRFRFKYRKLTIVIVPGEEHIKITEKKEKEKKARRNES